MTIRTEVIGDCTLILGDCREVLPTLPKVDAVVTDPPFSIPHEFGVAKGNGSRVLQWAWDKEMTRHDVVNALSAAMDLVPSFFTFCGLSQATMIADAAEARGFIAKPAAWVKECPPPAGKGNWWPSGLQMAVYGYREGSGAYFGDDDPKRSNVFVADSYRFGQPGKVDHPTQTPLSLMWRLVRALVPRGGCVIDPFAGSGTTGVAAVKLGRSFIGIEREPKYFDIACRRISDAYKQPDLFIQPPAPKHVQEALL